MDRSSNPTSINRNAKYLPNTISNVLNSIQKFDQGTLAWPTGPRTKQLCRVPLAGTPSNLISNSRCLKSKYCERVNKKNTFYKILQDSQDQPSLEKSAKGKGIELKPHADDIYNDIYDIVRTYLKIKRHPQPEVNQGQRDASPKVTACTKDIYRVRRLTETPTLQKYSKGEGEKSKTPTAKIPIVEFYRPPEKRTDQRLHFVTETHKSICKSKNKETGIHKCRKLSLKEANKGQNIVKETSKGSAKGRHGSPTAHRKQAIEAQKRSTEVQKGNAKKSVKLQKKSPKGVPHLNRITKAVKDRFLGDSKKSSRFQQASAKVSYQQDISRGSYKLEKKSPAKKDKSRERPQFQDESQDNPRVSVKLREKSLEIKDYLKDISKFSPKAKHCLLNEIYKIGGAKSKKGIIQGIPDNTKKSKIQESVTEGKNSKIEGKPNKIKESQISETGIDGQKRFKEGKPNNKTENRTPKEAYKLRLELKTKPESIRKIRRNRILQARNTENQRKPFRKILHIEPIIPNEPYEPPPINLSKISSVTPEPVQPSRLSQIRKSTLETQKSRKLSVASTAIYQEKLWKLKEYLNNMEGDHTEEISLDIEGIQESDLLYYPYDDIYKSTKEDKDNSEVHKDKKKPPEKGLKPTKIEKQSRKPLEKKSACIMCKAIRRPVEDAPFLVQMRKEQKRQELLAYRAHIAMCHKPSQGSRARPLAIRDLDKKLYTLKDKDIVFTRPKRSNSSIFPSSSKTKACLKRCRSFTFPKESSPIICSCGSDCL